VTAARARSGLARRQALGSAIELPDGRWCARHLLVRIHAASRSRRRRRVDAVPVATYVRFGGRIGVGHDVGISSQIFVDYRLEKIDSTLPLAASDDRGLDVPLCETTEGLDATASLT